MANLPKRKLGRTGLEITVLGFGAMELRGPGQWRGRPLEPGQAQQVLNTVLDNGINFIDTSIDYGESEENIGKYISHRRGEYFLASKCGCIVDPSSIPASSTQRFRHIYTRKNITDGINQSLKRMKTDHLDLVQFHGSPSKQVLEQEDAIQTLLDLKREGKVRFIGSSSTLPDLPDLIQMGAFDAFQVPYSALEREHEALITQAAKAGAGTVIRGGVARGGPAGAREELWKVWDRARLDELLDGISRVEFMLRFTITHPELSTTIVGTLNPEHLKQNVAAALKGPLPASVYNEAKRRLAAAGSVPAGAS
jgi:aryl-alcohol dehydrogenase-like predicted oxidoreductase